MVQKVIGGRDRGVQTTAPRIHRVRGSIFRNRNSKNHCATRKIEETEKEVSFVAGNMVVGIILPEDSGPDSRR